MSNRKKNAKTTADIQHDEVEELLRATEEDVFLKINLNSHTIRGSSSQIINPDLDRRFQALKSNTKPKPHTHNHQTALPTTSNTGGDDDFLGRFEALKKSLPSYQNDSNGKECVGEEEEEEEDEVEKVIRWAMDAARLDPSPESDAEEDQETDDDYDSEEDNVQKRKKGNNSKKK